MHPYHLIIKSRGTCATLAASLGLLLPLSAAPDSLVQTISFGDQTVTMLLTRQNLRGPDFSLRRQQVGGGIRIVNPVPERAYLGTVDGIPDAISCGIQLDDGTLKGAIIFKRGTTWYTLGDQLVQTKATEYEAFTNYRFPSESTVSPGQGGSIMSSFDLALDITNGFFTASGTDITLQTTGSLERIEFDVNLLRAIYMRDSLIRPYLGRILLRADPASDPYNATVDGSALADLVRAEWNTNQTDSARDLVSVVSEGEAGNFFSWFSSVGTDSGYSHVRTGANGEFGEALLAGLSLNWNARIGSGGDPEGRTATRLGGALRISGTENYRMLAYRNSLLANNTISSEGTYSGVELPPYASLDTVRYPERLMTGRLLISEHSPVRVIVPAEDLGVTWQGGNEPYEDGAWTSGSNGVGYDRGGTTNNISYSSYIGTDVISQMSDSTSCLIRIPFSVSEQEISEWNRLLLKMRFDDGFAAYLNGKPVLSVNTPPSLNHLSSATGLNEDAAAILYQDFDLTAHLEALKSGLNILAIHGLNEGPSSSDFLIQPKLLAGLEATKTPTPRSIFPLANDHDANGQSLTLISADTTSAAGGAVTLDGNSISYTPPENAPVEDWFHYEVVDTADQSAQGVVLIGSSLALENLAVSPMARTVPETGLSGGLGQIDVESRGSWTWRKVPEDASWLSSGVAENQNGSQVFSYSVRPNQSLQTRTADLIFEDGSTTLIHTVVQQGVEDPQGSSLETAGLLEIGSTVDTTIGYPGDADFYRLEVEADAIIELSASGTLDTLGVLRDGSGAVLILSTDIEDGAPDLNFAISTRLNRGTYFLQIRSTQRNQTGRYSLRSSQVLVPVISLRSDRNPEGVPTIDLSFTGQEGSLYRVERSADLVRWGTVESGIRFEGNQLTRSYPLTPATEWKGFLRVVEERPPGWLENPILLGIVGSPGDQVSFDTFASTIDTELGLFNAEGDLLEFVDDTTNEESNSNLQSRIQYRFPGAGTYYLAATQYNTDFGDEFSASGGPSGGSITLNYGTEDAEPGGAGGIIGENGALWFAFEIVAVGGN